MKRILCILPLLAFLFVPLLGVTATAEASTKAHNVESTDDAAQDSPSPSVEQIMADFLSQLSSLMPEDVSLPVTDAEGLEEAVGVHGLLSANGAQLDAQREELLAFAALLGGMTLLTLLLSALTEDGGHGRVATTALHAVLAVALCERTISLLTGVTESLHRVSAFFSSLVPLFSAVTLAGGGERSAAVGALGMSLTVRLLDAALTELLLPLAGVLLALWLIGLLGEGGGAALLCRQVRSVVLWGMGLIGTLVAAATALQTTVASAADSMALRTARYTLSGMLPTVGGTVAGTLSTLLGGLAYVKSTVGVGVIAVLLTMLVPPLLQLLILRLMLSLSGALTPGGGERSLSRVTDGLRSVLDVYIAIFALSGVLMLLETVLFIRCGAALA